MIVTVEKRCTREELQLLGGDKATRWTDTQAQTSGINLEVQ